MSLTVHACRKSESRGCKGDSVSVKYEDCFTSKPLSFVSWLTKLLYSESFLSSSCRRFLLGEYGLVCPVYSDD
ncbi:hypothetical protein D918_05704 [Trichuris suis]|nr:hypothetical protein D918_05704 [Trichuris suis]